jgi:polyisoprenoid-binding protein YceI
MKRWFSAVALVLAVAGSSMAAGSSWTLDPNHSTAEFTVRHLGISNVQGSFTKVTGTLNLDDSDISKSTVTATVDLSSVDTRVTMRDNDLKSDKFFNVAQFPTMTFQSTKIWKTGDGTAKMTGNLTLHGVTKEITFDVTGPTAAMSMNNMLHRGAEATGKLDRRDFGITADEGIVGDDISITLDVEMVQPAPGAPAPGR